MTTQPPGTRVRVGVVGVGTMGLPMAGNLVRAGFEVLGHRRSAMPPEFAALGATAVASPAELAARSDVVLVVLPGPEALLDVTLGPRGLAAGAHPGLVVVEMSTLAVAVKERCRDALAAGGAAMLDAPVSGMPAMVTARTATVFASGDEAAFATVLPVLDALAGRVHHLGPFGAGSAVKYIAQLLLGIHTLAAAEALGLARAAGLDLDRLLEVLTGTIAGSAALTARGTRMAHGVFRPAPGPVATLQEGLEQVEVFARGVGAATPLLDLAVARYGDAIAAGHGEDDIAVMVDVLNPPAV